MNKIAVILALPVEYSSSAMLRCKGVIEGLREIGNEVVCFSPSQRSKSLYSDGIDKTEEVNVIRYGKPLLSGTMLSENINESKGIRNLVVKLLYTCFRKFDIFGASIVNIPYRKVISEKIKKEKFDYVISFSDPLTAHVIGKYCKKNSKKVKYIQQWGDPLSGDIISKTGIPIFVRKIIEADMIKNADRICYVSPFTLLAQKKMFHRYAHKMIFTPTPSLSYGNDLGCEKKRERELRFGYFGSYYSSARNILPFYQASRRAKDIVVYIIGDSDISLESGDGVAIHQRLGKKELEYYIKECDILVCLMNLKGNQIPGKVYHDSSLEKDILFIKDGEYGDEIQNFFDKFDHYTFVENEENKILQAIENYRKNGVPTRKPVEDFMPVNIAKKMMDGI